MIRVVLFDLDGVIRHFDPADVASIESRHGLVSGSIIETAFATPLLEAVTTGRITRAEWVRQVGEQLGNAVAADAWGRQQSRVDSDLLELSDELRALGVRTAILTNGTDTIPSELVDSGIAERFDRVFNSAGIGFAKPDRRAFRHVLDALEVSPNEVFFTDDSPSKVAGAAELSIPCHVFENVDGLRGQLLDAGVARLESRLTDW